MDLLQGQLSGGLVNQLSQQLGTDPDQTASAASGIVSTLMGALAKNASTPDGANALSAAIDQDHDGSILNDVMGYITGNNQVANTSTANGAGILNHALGEKQEGVMGMISKMTGMDSSSVMSMAIKLAPLVMGAIGQVKNQNGLDANGLSSLLSGSVQTHTESNPAMAMISQFLDQDHDGSIMDDLAGMGMKLFSSFLSK